MVGAKQQEQSKLHVRTASVSATPKNQNRKKKKTTKTRYELSFPEVIDDVAPSTRLMCWSRAFGRRTVIIIMGHFSLTFEYFHSKFNNFWVVGSGADEGTRKLVPPHPPISLFYPHLFRYFCHCHFLGLFRFSVLRYVLHLCLFSVTCACRTISAYFLFVGKKRKFAYIYIYIQIGAEHTEPYECE